MKVLNENYSDLHRTQDALLIEINKVLPPHYSPISDFFELSWEQWLVLSSYFCNKGEISAWHLAKNIGLDMQSGILKKPLL
ncbi:hypothetical protein [Acinetobacter lwoffii]|uniref:hypothetical protein n=1 Tax=Acinetobacter lwoffii TaxID=28090 RepID=UPI00168D83BB|nr:hypothetical protein [Acinetobacter lwoffii]